MANDDKSPRWEAGPDGEPELVVEHGDSLAQALAAMVLGPGEQDAPK